ncbi:MAG TPA: MFS transporter [Gaiellaceae bacterium]|jgi:MFS family permease|nr:MFS transporter [Gaiellaceae bacterium]
MRLLPPGRDRRRYLAIAMVDALGSGTFAPVTILFLTQIVGLSPVKAGLGLAIAAAVGLATTPFAGSLADRFDARTLTMAGFALAGVGFVAYTAVHSFAGFLVAGVAIEIVDTIASNSRKMLIFRIAGGNDRVALAAYERSVRNAGYGLGGLLASVALAIGTRDAYVAVLLANAASFLLGAAAVTRLPRAPAAPRAAGRSGGYGRILRHKTYVALAAVSSVLWLNDSILKVGLAVWLVERTSVPHYVVGLLFTLNTVMVVLLQVRISRGAASTAAAARLYRLAGGVLIVSCALFALAADRSSGVAAALLVGAVAALTLGELLASSTEWAVSFSLARDEIRGRYLAFFSMGSGLQQAVGPAVVTALITAIGGWGWLFLAVALGGAGTLGAAVAGRARVPVGSTSG